MAEKEKSRTCGKTRLYEAVERVSVPINAATECFHIFVPTGYEPGSLSAHQHIRGGIAGWVSDQNRIVQEFDIETIGEPDFIGWFAVSLKGVSIKFKELHCMS
jgi:hypothetical protein